MADESDRSLDPLIHTMCVPAVKLDELLDQDREHSGLRAHPFFYRDPSEFDCAPQPDRDEQRLRMMILLLTGVIALSAILTLTLV